jgi:hypothetical protein
MAARVGRVIGGLVVATGGHGPTGALLAAAGEQLADTGLADSDPTAGLWSAGPAEDPAADAVRFLANPALRALSLVLAGPGGTGTACEIVLAVTLAVLPFVLSATLARRTRAQAHSSATVAQPVLHRTTGVLVTSHTTPSGTDPVDRDGDREGGNGMTGQTLESVRAEALFVSHAQRSDELTADQVRAVVLETVRRYGTRHLAALVAAEFGEHPETAVRRMSWALGTVRAAYPDHAGASPSAA